MSAPIAALCLDPLDHRNDAQGTLVAVFCNQRDGHEGPHTYSDVKSLNRGARWLTYDVKWIYQWVPERTPTQQRAFEDARNDYYRGEG